MTANDLATAGFIDSWMRALVALLPAGTPGAAPAAAGQAEVVLYSV
jgi:hypothetical protein